jgi:DNA-binding GntR family transcriptional regulator
LIDVAVRGISSRHNFGIPNSMLAPVAAAPSLIDQTYREVVGAIADGSLAPGQRIRQAELAKSLGCSRQPISHVLHLLKRQGLVEDYGRKGLQVTPLDPRRVLELYQLRTAIDTLAARLAAEAIWSGSASPVTIDAVRGLMDRGAAFDATTPVATLVRADAAFHRGLYDLSGNLALEEMTAPMWPHLMRSMASVLGAPGYATRIWSEEHPAILNAVLRGDVADAEAAARQHAEAAALMTARHLRRAA